MLLNKEKLESEHFDPPLFSNKKEHNAFGQHTLFLFLSERALKSERHSFHKLWMALFGRHQVHGLHHFMESHRDASLNNCY